MRNERKPHDNAQQCFRPWCKCLVERRERRNDEGSGCVEHGQCVLPMTEYRTRCAPSPLVGEGWGGGSKEGCTVRHPPPCPFPTGGEGTLRLEPSNHQSRRCHSRGVQDWHFRKRVGKGALRHGGTCSEFTTCAPLPTLHPYLPKVHGRTEFRLDDFL